MYRIVLPQGRKDEKVAKKLIVSHALVVIFKMQLLHTDNVQSKLEIELKVKL